MSNVVEFQRPDVTVSHQAQIVARSLFPKGVNTQATFGKGRELTEYARKGIEELAAAELITVLVYKTGSMSCIGKRALRYQFPYFARLPKDTPLIQLVENVKQTR